MQLVEFGLGLDSLYDQAAVKRKIGEVEAQFDLVMIAERFDESMVLMADLLCWDLADVVNLKMNARAKSNKVRSIATWIGQQAGQMLQIIGNTIYLLYFPIPSCARPIFETLHNISPASAAKDDREGTRNFEPMAT